MSKLLPEMGKINSGITLSRADLSSNRVLRDLHYLLIEATEYLRRSSNLGSCYVGADYKKFSTFKDLVNGAGRSVLVARDEKDIIVGFVILRFSEGKEFGNDESKRGSIDYLGVTWDERGRGIGRMLLVAAVEYLNELDAKCIGIRVAVWNEKAIHLYKSLGFDTEYLQLGLKLS